MSSSSATASSALDRSGTTSSLSTVSRTRVSAADMDPGEHWSLGVHDWTEARRQRLLMMCSKLRLPAFFSERLLTMQPTKLPNRLHVSVWFHFHLDDSNDTLQTVQHTECQTTRLLQNGFSMQEVCVSVRNVFLCYSFVTHLSFIY